MIEAKMAVFFSDLLKEMSWRASWKQNVEKQ